MTPEWVHKLQEGDSFLAYFPHVRNSSFIVVREVLIYGLLVSYEVDMEEHGNLANDFLLEFSYYGDNPSFFESWVAYEVQKNEALDSRN